LPGTVLNRLEPYAIDREAAQARQRTVMDLESATFAMIAEAIRHRQCPTSSAATCIKRSPAQPPRPCPLTLSTSSLLIVDSPPAVQNAAIAPVAGPSSARQPRPNSLEQKVITKICKGEGISSYEIQGLLEQCGICKLHFTGSVLCSHIFECSYSRL
jgi:hypothetical protein